jgi:hypothetical protein
MYLLIDVKAIRTNLFMLYSECFQFLKNEYDLASAKTGPTFPCNINLQLCFLSTYILLKSLLLICYKLYLVFPGICKSINYFCLN